MNPSTRKLIFFLKGAWACGESTRWVERHADRSPTWLWNHCPDAAWLIWIWGRTRSREWHHQVWWAFIDSFLEAADFPVETHNRIADVVNELIPLLKRYYALPEDATSARSRHVLDRTQVLYDTLIHEVRKTSFYDTIALSYVLDPFERFGISSWHTKRYGITADRIRARLRAPTMEELL